MQKGDHETSQEEIHLALLQAISEGICFTDFHNRIRFWNDAAVAISGFSNAEAVCSRQIQDVFFLSGIDGRPAQLPAVAQQVERGSMGYYLRHKDGHAVPVIVQRLSVRMQGQLPMGILNLFRVSEASDSWAEVRSEGLHEMCPGWLEAEAGNDEGGPSWEVLRPTHVLFVQIDDFSNLAHRLGPEAAEKLVELLDRTTSNCLQNGGNYQRVPQGGVLVLLSPLAKHDPAGWAERLAALIRSARFQWWGQTIAITVSIGCTPVQPHDKASAAISRAEVCLRRAQEAGGDKIVLADSQ